MGTVLTGEPPGDQIPKIDPAYRRLAQAVLLQTVLDATQKTDPVERNEALRYLSSEETAPELATWKMLAGIPPHSSLNPDILEKPCIAAETGRALRRMCGK